MQTHPHVDVAATMLGTEPLVRAQLSVSLGEQWLIDDPSATFIRIWDPRRRPSRTDAVSLRPSTQFFTVRPGAPHLRQLIEPGLVRDRADGSFRVLYNMHSSKAELRDLLSKLRPKHVTPIAGSTSGL
jgi:hypothetical protein